MNLVRFNKPNGQFPWRSPGFDGFSNYVDQLFDVNGCRDENNKFAPPANIIETNENFRIEIAAPGFDKSDFNIHLENDNLNISKEAEKESAENNEKFSRKEYSYNSFKRTFVLSKNIDTNSINAEYKDGILKVILPKMEHAKEKPARDIKIS